LRLFLSAAALLTLIVAPVSAGSISICDQVAGNLVQNCGFETGSLGPWTGGNSVEPSGTFGLPANSGNDYLAFGSVGGDAVTSQTLVDSAGSYTFSFYVNSDGSTPNDFHAYWDGTLVYSYTNAAAFPYTQHSFGVVGVGNDTISFGGRDDPAFFAVDDVVVTGNVPEPGTLGLFLGGLGIVGAALRRWMK
jgi:hypothetical protein